jgi:hypothetical protein
MRRRRVRSFLQKAIDSTPMIRADADADAIDSRTPARAVPPVLN